MIYRLFRAMAMIDSGVECRRCSQGIARRDLFGQSEGVCPACRA